MKKKIVSTNAAKMRHTLKKVTYGIKSHIGRLMFHFKQKIGALRNTALDDGA